MAVSVVAIENDGSAVYEDDEDGERWTAGEHFLTLEAI